VRPAANKRRRMSAQNGSVKFDMLQGLFDAVEIGAFTAMGIVDDLIGNDQCPG